MRTSGLPCRATLDCDSVFTVDRQDSMESLREAGGRRDRHELDTHGYKHVIRDVTPATPFAQPAGARRGRRRKSEELSAV